MQRLSLDGQVWSAWVRDFGRMFYNAAGKPQTIDGCRSRVGQRRFHVPRATRRALAALGDAPRTLFYELAKIKSDDIVLPAQTAAGDEKTIRLRHVTEPDESQAVLLHRLGLRLPRRLRRLDNPTEPTD